jgi:integrase
VFIEKRGKNRYRVRGRGPDGREHNQTFRTDRDARRYKASEESKLHRGEWIDPAAGRVTFADWWAEWRSTMHVRQSTIVLYDYLARRYLLPYYGELELGRITTSTVRHWLKGMRATKLSDATVAKAYRLLVRVLGQAVEDRLVARVPTVKGAAVERSPEMRCPTPGEIADVVAAIAPPYRALVLLAGFGGLRWGEAAGLRRRNVDLLHGIVHVVEQLTEVNGALGFGPLKSDASRRSVALPAFLVDELEQHLAQYGEPGADGLVFPAAEGGPMRRSNFRRRLWLPALRSAGLEGIRFHDLRHAAGTMAAWTGAPIADVMARLGHSTPRAALRYQHATADRGAEIAAKLDAFAASTRPGDSRAERETLVDLR